jgi:tripartite-type tricarboxylate transporter receptor subunit TctC
MMALHRRNFLSLGATVLATTASVWSRADQSRPILFIVPLAPGGGLDFVARAMANYVLNATGRQIVVENRSGAGGTIGIEAAAKSLPDGYTVLVTNDNIASAPHLLPVSVDYLTAFAPVIEVARQPQILSVHPSLGVSTLADLIRLAKLRPGLGYASSGAGSNQNILGEWLKKVTDIQLVHVPYRGAGQAIGDLLAGRVPIGILGPTALMPHYKSGELRLLAQSSETRSPFLPEIPTFQEAGAPGIILDAWYGVFMPVGAPATALSRLNTEINDALSDAGTRDNLLGAADEPVGGTAEHLSALFRSDYEKYGRLIRELNIRIG